MKNEEKNFAESISGPSVLNAVDTQLLKALKLHQKKTALKEAVVDSVFCPAEAAGVLYSEWKWDSESQNRSICLAEQ